MDRAAPDPLQVIRDRIDAIDETIHRLLIDRSGVIAELIAVKGTAETGVAFRPGREADMMRRLVQRHEGSLPIVAVEHIWREIITTFTAMQAPFGITAGPAEDPLAMRDAIRFYFGFGVPVTEAETAEAAIRQIGPSGRQIAVVAAGSPGRWWDGLAGAGAPKVFAKLPFIETPSRPAELPAYVVGPPLKPDAPPDISLLAFEGDDSNLTAFLSCGGQVAARIGDEFLVEIPMVAGIDDIAALTGRALRNVRVLGGFAQPIRFVADRTA